MLNKLKSDLQKLADPQKAELLQRFFKTGPGQYGAGDIFLGIIVPNQRKIAKQYSNLKLTDLKKLLTSRIHEHRLVALLILVGQYASEFTLSSHKRTKSPMTSSKSCELPVAVYNGILRRPTVAGLAQDKMRTKIYNFYLNNTGYINNWDLVDLTAPKIVGNYLLDQDRKILYQLAKSKNLWQKRIAIIATFEFIRHNQFIDTIKISQILLNDSHDLIHKAVGWMLREVGKRDEEELIKFLNKHIHHMSRTTLRYSIERFPEKKRKYYLHKK